MKQQQHRRLNRQDYKTLSLAALGGTLEFYDFIIFVFFAATIGDLFFPTDMPEWLRQAQTFGIFAAGYFARPLGGIIMAHFGDKVGRKKMFSLSILLMALSTLGMGMLPTYPVIGIAAPLLLLLLRILQGAAIGGEVPGAWVFVAEHVPVRRIGFACGVLTAGLTLHRQNQSAAPEHVPVRRIGFACGVLTAGILLGSVVATLLHSLMTQQAVLAGGWRIPFFLGGIFGLFAMYLRRWLQETPIFIEMQARQALAEELPLKSVVKNHRIAVGVSMLLTWLLSAGIVVVILMTPTYLQKQFAIAPVLALQANSVAILALTVGCVLVGYLIDRFGSSKVFIIGSILLAGCSWTFYHAVAAGVSEAQLFLSYGMTGLAVGLIGGVPYVMVRAFPPEVRFSGISFSYNVAYAIFGGLTPIFVTLLMKITPMAPAFYVVAISLLGMLLGIYLQRDRMVISSPNALEEISPS